MFIELCKVFLSSFCKNSCMDFRVQCLDAPVQHLREAGEFGHLYAFHSLAFEFLVSASRGNDFHSLFFKGLCELHNPFFIRNGYQRGFYLHFCPPITIFPSVTILIASRKHSCSSFCTFPFNVSVVSPACTGVFFCMIIFPLSTCSVTS